MGVKAIVLILAATLFVVTASVVRDQFTRQVLDLEHFAEIFENRSQVERVVGGSPVADDEFIPYQVSLQYLTNSGRQVPFCGGSIVSPDRILTAAHCVDGQNAERISVVGGVRDLKAEEGQRVKVTSYEIHENYTKLETCDIAMLKIEPALELDGQKLAAIDVSSSEAVGGGEEVTLTGWGSMRHFGQGFLAKYPTRLQKLSYKTMTNADCKRTMDRLTDMEICALEAFGKGACNGDSGGPLVMAGSDGPKQVGIVSYGTVLCASNSPDVYTRVSMFTDWIKSRL